MLRKVLLVLVLAIAGAVAFVATRESTYSVTRSISVEAPPEVVFGMVNDLREWVLWSPWDSLDPDMEKRFEGPSSGVGAIYAWAGDEQVGKGTMTVIESRPPEEVSFRLEFVEPWVSVSNSGFTIRREGSSSFVTWTMLGRHHFVGKAMSLFMDPDEMIGPDFERGLEALRDRAEAEALRRAAEAAQAAPTDEVAEPPPPAEVTE